MSGTVPLPDGKLLMATRMKSLPLRKLLISLTKQAQVEAAAAERGWGHGAIEDAAHVSGVALLL